MSFLQGASMRKDEWREKNREIFDRYLKYKVRYRVSHPPDIVQQFVSDTKAISIGTSMVYDSVEKFRKLGLFDETGNLTPLGVKVKELKDYIMKNKSVSRKNLEKLYGRKAVDAVLMAGFFREEGRDGWLRP